MKLDFNSRRIIVICTATAVAIVVGGWLIVDHMVRKSMTSWMEGVLEEVTDDIDSNINSSMSFVGNAICRSYGQPEAITPNAVAKVMQQYTIDEMNVVNSHGIVIGSSLAELGYDMGSKPKTAEFNCLLHGAITYSQGFRAAVEDRNLRRKYVGVAFPSRTGYIQIGVDESRTCDDFDYIFGAVANGWKLNYGSYIICASLKNWMIESCGNKQFQPGRDTLENIGITSECLQQPDLRPFKATVYGKQCLCLQVTAMRHRIVIVTPYLGIMAERRKLLWLTVLTVLILYPIVTWLLVRLGGLVASLKAFIEADRVKRGRDLALAHTIQQSSLPVAFPNNEEYRVFACMTPAREIGGDFYDFTMLPNGKLLFVVADVSGKGIPAAMFMMRARTTLRSACFQEANLAKAIDIANNMLSENNDAEMFVTAWIGIYDRETGEIEYVNAGHNNPLVKRCDGSVEWVKGRRSLPLAAMEGVRHTVERMKLERGDSIFIYTDGVSEAMNRDGELYGDDRLLEAFKRAGELFVQEVNEDLKKFVNGAEASDDITFFALDRLLSGDKQA